MKGRETFLSVSDLSCDAGCALFQLLFMRDEQKKKKWQGAEIEDVSLVKMTEIRLFEKQQKNCYVTAAWLLPCPVIVSDLILL